MKLTLNSLKIDAERRFAMNTNYNEIFHSHNQDVQMLNAVLRNCFSEGIVCYFRDLQSDAVYQATYGGLSKRYTSLKNNGLLTDNIILEYHLPKVIINLDKTRKVSC